MKALETQPRLVEQVYEAILEEITSGRMQPGDRVIQEQLAKALGVSRQPVQQALLLMKNQGVLSDAPGRGLQVAPLDLDYVRNMYDMRAVMEGLACRLAAEHNPKAAKARGPALIRTGRKAVDDRSVKAMIAADIAFHQMIYELSGNPLIAPAMETHWTNTQRIMGEVLLRDDQPRNVWEQHEAMLDAIVAGDAAKAEKLGRVHISRAADFMIERLQEKRQAPVDGEEAPARRLGARH